MGKKHIISLAGDLASGKGAVSRELAERLKYEIYRNGEYFRKLAKENNMDVTTFNEYVKTHPEIDIQIENSCKEYAKTHDNLVIDARLGWYAVPESFKIYLQVENRKSSENFNTVQEQKEDLQKRFKLENERYFELYNIHKEDLAKYDLVINTSNITPAQVANVIIEEYEKWLNK